MIIKKFGLDFDSDGGALTLPPKYVGDGASIKTHDNGWTVCGVVKEDYFYWVNDFYLSFPPIPWDYRDI